ncbi:putative NADH:flavin oxidoreductase 1 [Mycena amicta]|nr:putative NADH:flavin oxidoreductase 1 [Mycena amicta]
MGDPSPLRLNKAVPQAREFYPLNEPEIGTFLGDDSLPCLFRPLTIRGVTFKNHVWLPPIGQFSSRDGFATDWHLVHVGSFAARGVGAICIEATAISPENRVTTSDLGIWKDEHMPGLQRIVDFSHAQGTPIGIQLMTSGRKSSVYVPWVREKERDLKSWVAKNEEEGWAEEVSAPSPIAFSSLHPIPREMTEEDLQRLEDLYVAATRRCRELGFDFIEIQAAHGYLLHQFVSPLSNLRTDWYGGQSLENRLRFPTRIIQRIRKEWPDKPLFLRISATDWVPGPERSENSDSGGTWLQWGVEQSKIWMTQLAQLAPPNDPLIDLLVVSAGGTSTAQAIPNGHGYQVHLAQALKEAAVNAQTGLLVGAVGLISDPELAEGYLEEGKADVIWMARELMRNPHWVLSAAKQLGGKVKSANQHGMAWL